MKRCLGALLVASFVFCGNVLAVDFIPTFPRFGKAALYHPKGTPDGVVLFVSGDGGWEPRTDVMAKQIAALGPLVVGIDIRVYLKALASESGACAYPAADLEALSQYIQKQQGFADYLTPILVGYSSGATLVYATLVQAPANTFAGAVSFGFCPDLEISKPFCKGAGLTWRRKKNSLVFDPASHLAKPWIAFHGDGDQVCDISQTRTFVSQVQNGKIVELHKVGHDFSVYRRWLPQFQSIYKELKQGAAGKHDRTTHPKASIGDLPLEEIAAQGNTASRMAVFFSGDGGWANLDQGVSAVLAKNGIPVVGVNSLKYFWKKRTPERAAADLESIIAHYTDLWHVRDVILVGYSFGADVIPFMASRLSPPAAEKIDLIALLGPSRTAEFEFHLTDWLGRGAKTARPVLPEIRKLEATPMLCFYGDQEDDSLCRSPLPENVVPIPLEGAHHFGGDYERIGLEIVDHLK